MQSRCVQGYNAEVRQGIRASFLENSSKVICSVVRGIQLLAIISNARIVSPMRIGLHQWDKYFIPLITLSSSNIPNAKQSILLGQQQRPSHIESAKSFHKEIVMKMLPVYKIVENYLQLWKNVEVCMDTYCDFSIYPTW